jgi:hypothetical protein
MPFFTGKYFWGHR